MVSGDRGTRRAPAVLAAVVGVALAGCGRDIPPPTPPVPLTATTTEHPEFDAARPPAEAVLAMVPSTARVLTVTDFDQVRVQLGVPDLTGEDLVSDRTAFWRQAEQEAPLLTGGMLRPVGSELMLDYGFTQDDVDWEAHWTGPDGNGFALAMRPDLDLEPVVRAVADGVGPLAGASVLREHYLVVAGVASEGEQVWANEPIWRGLTDDPATATYARRGCVPVIDALGPDAGSEELDQVIEQQPLALLDDLPAFALAFGDHVATVRTERHRDDLFTRLDLAADWPDPTFAEEFRDPVGDPGTGRLGFTVPRPPRAAALALLEELPFAICADATPLPEPTGL